MATFTVNGREYPQLRVGTCYPSSRLMSLVHPLEYVEGVLVIGVDEWTVPLAHAWCVDPDGAIVDVTLSAELRASDNELRYIEVRRGTNLTVTELGARGNPDDLMALADTYRVSPPR